MCHKWCVSVFWRDFLRGNNILKVNRVLELARVGSVLPVYRPIFRKISLDSIKKGYKIGIFFAVVNVGLKFERI